MNFMSFVNIHDTRTFYLQPSPDLTFPQISLINTSLLRSINDHDMIKENNGSIHKALIKVQSFMCRVRQLH
jgi:hypothetical protein